METASLDRVDAELDCIYRGEQCRHAVITLLVTVNECELPAARFRRLIEANRRNQLGPRLAVAGFAAGGRRREQITRHETANFYCGIRLPLRSERHAMYAVARRVDGRRDLEREAHLGPPRADGRCRPCSPMTVREAAIRC